MAKSQFEREDLLPKQAAALIGMSLGWFYEKLREGNGPKFRRRGRLILIKKSDLEEWDSQPVIP